MGRRVIGLSGKKYGNLTVIRRIDSKDERILWECKCRCGNSIVVRGDHLKSGRVRSCGCIPRGKKKARAMSSQEMTRTTESLFRLEYDRDNPYQSLANAIVAIAVDDYRSALQSKNNELESSVNDFFDSNWFRMLTKVDASVLKSLIRKEQNGEMNRINIAEVVD